MEAIAAVEQIRRKFKACESPVRIAVNGVPAFSAVLINGGIEVDNLQAHNFLHWTVFREALSVLARKDGRARLGDAEQARLGDPALPLDSIEGHIAHVVYGRGVGDPVFARVKSLAAILVWAGICKLEGDRLVLLE